jgi:TetR/AcrR family transcriptional regulator, transcriptional repressor for nem operon
MNTVPMSRKIADGARPRGRPREFDVDQVVAAAKDLFWERGYQGSTLSDLETAAGLKRSSLYQAFGTKEELFDEALDLYINTFMESRLAPMEREGADARAVIGFFRGLATLFRDDADWRRGCLWVNSLAELTGREPGRDARAAEYRVRLLRAFSNALTPAAEPGEMSAAVIRRRSQMLAATTFGVWLTVRFDRLAAARLCDSVTAEIRSWLSDAPAIRR